MTNWSWEHDPKRLAFQAARYLFVAKMLEGKRRVLEVGCADGQGARIVRQHVGGVVGIDTDAKSVEEAQRLASEKWPVQFLHRDIMVAPIPGFDAVYSLDLFEHIEDEERLLTHLHACAPVCIIGTPSLQSQRYASEISRAGHVNCVSKQGLRERMQRHWRQVFVFGINDTTLHCGHDGMTHYLIAIGCA
jgi:2-polyprenyl-3-methyl-5-hydroxy-6-metoxy-1,4-benzoquinol methylase